MPTRLAPFATFATFATFAPFARPARLLAFVATLGASACLSMGPAAPGLPDFPADGPRLLFIGNSLTYTNDLPGMTRQLLALGGVAHPHVASVAFPDYALEDHWYEGTAPRFLRERDWEFVVMQQGPSSLPENQAVLRAWTVTFAPLVRGAGAEPVLLMVWPGTDRLAYMDDVRTSYANAAAAVNGLLAPGGEAWKRFGDYGQLYSDVLHPSRAGTYLAALTIVGRTHGLDPLALPARIPGGSTDTTFVRALQRAARAALDSTPARPAP